MNTIRSGMIFVASATARWAMQLCVQCVLPPNGPPLPFWVFGAILPVFAPQMPAPRPILAGRGSWGLRGARRRPPHPTHVARLGCEAVATHERVFGGCTGYSMSYLGVVRYFIPSGLFQSFFRQRLESSPKTASLGMPNAEHN